MAASAKHLLAQRPVIAAIAKTALTALGQRLRGSSEGMVTTPGPQFTQRINPRPPGLIRDYVRTVYGDPSSYRHTLPAHLFPQWGFPLLAKTLSDIPYPLMRVLNGGCDLVINAPLPATEPLHVSAQLVGVDDNGSRAVLEQRLITGVSDHPDALIATMFAVVPLKQRNAPSGGAKTPKARPRVSETARELAHWKLTPQLARDFAILTGDINPIHWLATYARASGFRNTILHGYATMAIAMETFGHVVLAGDMGRLARFNCKFVRPLTLPARVGLYLEEDSLWVGDAPGGPAYMTANVEIRNDDHELAR